MAGGCVLVIGEPAEGAVAPVTLEVLGAGRALAQQLGVPVEVAVLGQEVDGQAAELIERGADRVHLLVDPRLAPYQADAWVPVLADLVRETGAQIVLLSHTQTGREFGPRLAFRLGTGIVTDCAEFQLDARGRLRAIKPVYGGNAVAEYTIAGDGVQVASLRPKLLDPAPPVPGHQGEVVRPPVRLDDQQIRTRAGERVRAAMAGPDLENAQRVVAGGRGVGGPENWRLIEEFADAIGAAVGASRAAVDAGWVPGPLQIGLTGAKISPQLYVAVGISGAVQHMAGCQGARTVVAINRDPEANIFKHAHIGVVGNVKEVLPALTRKCRELTGR
ncbi:MAG: electron transfer flavoprotein subunit alpha/FixB family protein [Chloroflexi bacterium]|jgi:electron transfer flavoprotein alpha subunit|nr:electron transfer flavoprotein subunit alpha/FixB family protein [Chloroflexota bacterium]